MALLAGIAATLGLHAYKLPFVWDYEIWESLMELSVVLALVRCGRCACMAGSTSCSRQALPEGAAPPPLAIFREAGWLARRQLCLLYLSASWWKLNRSFLDPEVSCAPVIFVQLALRFLPPCLVPVVRDSAVLRLLALASPGATDLLELLLPSFLAAAPTCGVLFGLLFHGLVLLVPPPNNAGGFSVAAAIWYIFFLPEGAAGAMLDFLCLPASCRPRAWLPSSAAGAASAAVLAAALARGLAVNDLAVPAYAVMALGYFRALAEVWRSTSRPRSSGAPRPCASACLLALTALYAFGLPFFGLQDMGAPTMYANLRVYGGSNHYLVPTDVLGVAGATLRVEATTSAHIRSLYPAEATGLLGADVETALRRAGHTGREFVPGSTRILGLRMGAGAVVGAEPSLPTEYLLPTMELRRLLMEARALREAFTLRYSHVSNPLRATLLIEDGGGNRTCTYVRPGRPDEPCAHDEPALQAPLPWPARKLLLYFPTPLAPGGSLKEAGCIS